MHTNLLFFLCFLPGSVAFAATAARPETPAVQDHWVSVGKHLQNPELYSTAWADNATILSRNKKKKGGRRLLVTKDAVTTGQILSLVPMERLGVRNSKKETLQSSSSSSLQLDRTSEMNCDDSGPSYSFSCQLTRPHEYHRASGLTVDTQVVVHAPSRRTSKDIDSSQAGWMGHLAATSSSPTKMATATTRRADKNIETDRVQSTFNCQVVPLLGALPLCALVATEAIPKGTALVEVDERDDEAVEELALQVLQRYKPEIAELRSYMAMAHPFPAYQPPAKLPAMKFHNIDTHGLKSSLLHADPHVLQVDDFLTSAECEAIIDWARPRLAPCLVKNAETGRVETDPTRTSTNANIPQSAVPTVTDKVCQLLQAPSSRHLEIFQVLRYTAGQTFVPHTDGFDGPVDACGFEQSGRLVTLFCYLNTMPPQTGGETRFTQLSSDNGGDETLLVAPVAGKAVLHFPNSVDLQEDSRTEHESIPVVDGEKWLFVTWCWKHARADPAYHEALIE